MQSFILVEEVGSTKGGRHQKAPSEGVQPVKVNNDCTDSPLSSSQSSNPPPKQKKKKIRHNRRSWRNILLGRWTATICSHSGSAAARFWLFWTTLAIPSGALARFGNIWKVSPRSAPLRIDASKVFLMNAASSHWEQMSGRKSEARRAKLPFVFFSLLMIYHYFKWELHSRLMA